MRLSLAPANVGQVDVERRAVRCGPRPWGLGLAPVKGPVQGPLQSHGVAGRVYPWTSSAAIVAGLLCPFAGMADTGPPAVPARPHWLLCEGIGVRVETGHGIVSRAIHPCSSKLTHPVKEGIAARRAVGARQRGSYPTPPTSNARSVFSRQTSACQSPIGQRLQHHQLGRSRPRKRVRDCRVNSCEHRRSSFDERQGGPTNTKKASRLTPASLLSFL